jgi:hypothetical protein
MSASDYPPQRFTRSLLTIANPKVRGAALWTAHALLATCHTAASDRASGATPQQRQAALLAGTARPSRRWLMHRQAEWPPEYRRSRWIDTQCAAPLRRWISCKGPTVIGCWRDRSIFHETRRRPISVFTPAYSGRQTLWQAFTRILQAGHKRAALQRCFLSPPPGDASDAESNCHPNTCIRRPAGCVGLYSNRRHGMRSQA